MNSLCEYCQRERNNLNYSNWTKHIEACKWKKQNNRRQKLNINDFFITAPKTSKYKISINKW